MRTPLDRPRAWYRRADGAARRRLPSPEAPLGASPARSSLHDERVAAVLGIGLGVCFTVCFLTGMYSHLEQHPEPWLPIPTVPAGLYRVTQGVHVATGIASIPLLFAKLWTVWPRFVAWPVVTSVAHAVERLSLVPLVGGALFQVVTGVSNIFHWYWFPFFFTTTHYDASFVVIGALVTHLLAKWSVTRAALRRGAPALERAPAAPGLMTRRGFLWTTAAASAVLTVGTVGETLGQPVPALQTSDLLAPRRPGTGPQGFPVNKPASEAGVAHLAHDLSGYRFRVEGPGAPHPLELTADGLRSLPRHRTELPIACVEGWSVSRTWEGVRVVDLLRAVGARQEATVAVESVEQRGPYNVSTLNVAQAHADDTLLALLVNGEELDIDHGYPLRLIAPDRPGVLQTKWVQRLVVT